MCVLCDRLADARWCYARTFGTLCSWFEAAPTLGRPLHGKLLMSSKWTSIAKDLQRLDTKLTRVVNGRTRLGQNPKIQAWAKLETDLKL